MARLKRDLAEKAIADFLGALGHDPTSPEFSETPRRVVDAYADEFLSGYEVDVRQLISEGSEVLGAALDPIALTGLSVISVCPHHLLPAEGEATILYWPGERVLGLGILAKLVNAYSRRLVLQETIAGNVADALMNFAGARGVFVRLTLRHTCLRLRGPEEHNAEATSYAARGVFLDPALVSLYLGSSEGVPQ